jgi:hypothetical protein
MIINLHSVDQKIVVLSNVSCFLKERYEGILLVGCLLTGKKLHLIRRIVKTDNTNERTPIVGHFDHILAINISTDGQFLVDIFKRRIFKITIKISL